MSRSSLQLCLWLVLLAAVGVTAWGPSSSSASASSRRCFRALAPTMATTGPSSFKSSAALQVRSLLSAALPLLVLPALSRAAADAADAADAVGEATSTATVPRPRLTAKEILAGDVAVRREALQEILFTLRLYGPLLEKKEYTAVRSQLRTEPAKSLRKTCRAARKYLDAPAQATFDAAYDRLIDSVARLDVLLLRRTQGEGVEALAGARDSEAEGLLAAVVEDMEKLLALLQ